MDNFIPCFKHSIDGKDIKAVNKILKSNFITQGNQVMKLEKKIKKFCKVKYATCVNSATSALHLSFRCLNLAKGDHVWTTTNTFISTATAAVYAGLNIDLIDIDHDTYNISLNHLENKLKKSKIKPKAVIVVHLGGHPCDMKKLFILKKKYKFQIIEDASHAFGSIYFKRRIGSCNLSDICIFSFHASKSFTTGEGGCLVTNNNEINSRSKLLREHGINRNINKKNQISPKFYDVQLLSLNFRMTDFQAALGISQIDKVDRWIKRKNFLAKFYLKNFNNSKIKFQKLLNYTKSSHHLFIINLQNYTNRSRNKMFQFLKKRNIDTNLHYIPLYRHSILKKYNFDKKNFPNSEIFFNNCLSIPIFVDLSLKNQKKIIKNIKLFLK